MVLQDRMKSNLIILEMMLANNFDVISERLVKLFSKVIKFEIIGL